MLKPIALMTFLIASSAVAQFTVAPFGAASQTAPIGDGLKNQCSNNRCAFEIIIKPYCFGTNLRAYPVNIQMDPTKDVKTNIVLTNAKDDTKKDNFEISFPANMTYASGGSRTSCMFKEGEDMTKVGNHTMACYVPWLNKSFTYTLKEWLSRINPIGFNSSPFNNYAGIGLPATLIPGQGNEVDENITCLYQFTNFGKTGTLIRSSVSCYFPSRLPDLSSKIAIKKDGVNITDAQITAYTNMIRIKLMKPLNAMSNTIAVKHGQMVIDTPPKHATYFSQPASATAARFFNPWAPAETETAVSFRSIAAVREKEGFDESNAYQSFTTQVKFPGMEGFCGGYYSPLMLFFDGKLPTFSGVSAFPLYGLREGTAVNWPEPKAPGYFLVHLKENETKVTSYNQLFGQTDKFENGFEALKEHDENGDDIIDSNDKIFSSLLLWNDKNGDGHSQAKELIPLSAKKVKSIGLKFTTRDVTKVDQRARAREKGKFTFVKGGKEVKADVFDVWLAPLEQ